GTAAVVPALRRLFTRAEFEEFTRIFLIYRVGNTLFIGRALLLLPANAGTEQTCRTGSVQKQAPELPRASRRRRRGRAAESNGAAHSPVAPLAPPSPQVRRIDSPSSALSQCIGGSCPCRQVVFGADLPRRQGCDENRRSCRATVFARSLHG